MRSAVLVVVIGCSGGASTPDAWVSQHCAIHSVTASCLEGRGRIEVTWSNGASSMNYCSKVGRPDVYEVTCNEGCNVEVDREYVHSVLARMPHALCEETPAPIDQRCEPGTCIPTRAIEHPDGGIEQTYLACEGPMFPTCVPGPAPTIAGYLQPCPPAAVAPYAMQGVKGILTVERGKACLIAWNEATATLATGNTIHCIGDWQCPEGSLCDDGITTSYPTQKRTAACKPGPRGVLTPDMLAP